MTSASPDVVQPPVRPSVRAGREVAKNLASLISGDALNRILRFGAAILFARALSLTEFGVLNTAVAAAGLVTVVATAGLVDLGTRDVAIDRASASDLAQRVLGIRLIVLAAASIPALGACVFVDGASFSLIAASVVMALSMTVAVDWVLRGLEHMRVLGVAWTLGGSAVAAGAVLVGWQSGSASAAMWAYAAGELTVTAVGWIALRGTLRTGLALTSWRTLVGRSWPLAVSAVVIYIYTANLDTILIAALRSSREAGLYSAPYRVFWVLSAVIVFASYAALPKLSRRSASGEESAVVEGVGLLARVLLCYSAIVVAGIEVLGDRALAAVFGSGFANAGNTLLALAAGLAWYAVGFPCGQSLIASDRGGGFLAGAVVAGLSNIAANLALIPLYGITGAAWATTGSFALGSIVWLQLRRLPTQIARQLVLGASAITFLAAIAVAVPGGAQTWAALVTAIGALWAARVCHQDVRSVW